MKTTSFVFALILLTGILACNKECAECPKPVTAQSSDTTKPVITVNSPTDLSTFIGGESILVNATFSDDRALSQYRIEVHNAFDGHTHGKINGAALPLAFDTIVSISGTVDSQQFNIYIPQDVAAGEYHFIVTALDAAGNEAIFVERDLTFINPNDTVPPGVSFNYPDFTATGLQFTFVPGKDTFQLPISATLFDQLNDGSPGVLKSYSLLFKHLGLHAKQMQTASDSGEVIYEITNTNIGGSAYGLGQTLILNKSDLLHDHDYLLELIIRDQKGNFIERDLKYHIRYF
ncbi:MAG: DUF4625 domain-containing protein [Sphingobacteriia bacterium]|nr:DUF4625 domain-containing protein [Sphingobacteriia bacterium]